MVYIACKHARLWDIDDLINEQYVITISIIIMMSMQLLPNYVVHVKDVSDSTSSAFLPQY